MKTTISIQPLLFGLLLVLPPVAVTRGEENWPRFRGAGGTGVAEDDPRLPTNWSQDENVYWAIEVPGQGWSCPVVWGDHVFVTSVIGGDDARKPKAGLYLGQGIRSAPKSEHRWMVYCFDLQSGNKLWEHQAHQGAPTVPRHPKSSYASETPVTDGERLYVLFGDVGLFAYDFDGQQVWQKMIDTKRTFLDYGAAASPVLADDQVIVVYDNLEESWIAAFDTSTGNENWRTPRDETHSWATPLVWENELRTEIVVPGKLKNRAYSPDGRVLWEFDGIMSNLVIPSPVAAHGLCYIGAGYVGDKHRPTFAIRPGASGDFTPADEFTDSEFIAWYQGTSAPYNTSQIVVGDYLYTLYDQGFLTCHNAKTGDSVYGKQRFSPKGSFTASPWSYNGKLFCLSEQGLTYVVELGPEFKTVDTNDLGELSLATPAIADGKLLVRTASKLYCVGN